MDVFQKRLIKLRGSKSKQQVAKEIGLSAVTYGRYENGERKPPFEEMKLIVEYYHVSADYLFGLSDVKSVDEDIQTVCKFTGLSEKAVNKLNEINEPLTDILSLIIADSQCGYLLGLFETYYSSGEIFAENTLNTILPVQLKNKDIAFTAIQNTLRQILDKTSDKFRNNIVPSYIRCLNALREKGVIGEQVWIEEVDKFYLEVYSKERNENNGKHNTENE